MVFRVWKLLLLCIVWAHTEADTRPLFVFGHMANSLPELEDFMAQGANAIEVDVTFAANGTALKFYHGPGCDCGRDCEKETQIGTYLSYLRNAVAEGGPFAGKLLLFCADMKVEEIEEGYKYDAGVSLAKNFISYLWKDVPQSDMVNVLLSMPGVHQKDVFKGILETLSQAQISSSYLDHVGYDVSGFEHLDMISTTYKELGIRQHRWQSDGILTCLVDIYPTLRMNLITDRRSSTNSSKNYVDKAYAWTMDMPITIRRFLNEDIDGIMTNKPGTVLEILKEHRYTTKYRLATKNDSPWMRII
ncbi:dermonecrotic toxin SPH-like isoform X1 [Haemaphysalis longicornis]